MITETSRSGEPSVSAGRKLGGRIGFLVDQRLFRTAEGYFGETPFVRFLLGFDAHFDELVLFHRVFDAGAATEAPYRIPEANVRIVDLPPYPRIIDLHRRPGRYWPAILRALEDHMGTLDALWLNFGHPVSTRALSLSRKHPGVRCFGVLRGAYDKDAAAKADGPRLVGYLARIVQQAYMRRFARLARRRGLVCFGFGHDAYLRLKRFGLDAHETSSSLLTEADLGTLDSGKADRTTDLLCVSRLSREKGVDVLLESLVGLTGADGQPARLRVVGSGPEASRLKEQAERLAIADRVSFDGHVPFGPELFARLADARVFVIPSRTEGVPKTLDESLAFGCPVVATAVGGIPAALESHEGILVPPEDPRQLRDALQSLLSEPERLRLMSEGLLRRYRPKTLEGQVRFVVERVFDAGAGVA